MLAQNVETVTLAAGAVSISRSGNGRCTHRYTGKPAQRDGNPSPGQQGRRLAFERGSDLVSGITPTRTYSLRMVATREISTGAPPGRLETPTAARTGRPFSPK